MIVKGLTCFNCPEISHPGFCNHVQHCNEGEFCSLKSVVDVYGDKTFHLGCLSANVCGANATTDGTVKCRHCCSTDLCNNYGCGEAGNLVRNSSICYQCDGQIEGESCHKVTFCDSDESVQYPYPAIGKRDYNRRSFQRINCCIGDLCNHGTSFNANTTATITASEGTDFILLFTEGYLLQYATAKVLMAGQSIAQMSVYNFASHKSTSFQLTSNQNEFPLDHNVFMTDGQQHIGVELHGNVKAAVFGFIYSTFQDGYSGGYLGIPSNFLSNNYIIPSFKVYKTRISNSMIAITPTDSATTTVQLTFKMMSGSVTYESRNYGDSDTLTVVLNKHETFEISHTSDLTGTSISSSSPIAVVSGNKCNFINPKSGCNIFIEMILPVDQLDHTYIIPYIATRTNSTVRVISVKNTFLNIKSNDKEFKYPLASKRYFDFYHDTISSVSGTSDVSVMLYPHEMDDYEGDASMMTIHVINQYLTEYDFVVPSGFTSFISVLVETKGLSGFILDGNDLKIETVCTTEINNYRFHNK